MTLSIIIVNYNGENFLYDCVGSLVKYCKGIDYEIIIVDNASNDNSIEIIKSLSNEKITLIESKTNLGFAKGNNLGVKNSCGEFVLLLNNDTILLDNLDLAVNTFKSEKAGLLGIKMLGKDNEYRRSAGNFPSPLRLLKLSSLYKNSKEFRCGKFNKDHYVVDWIEGSFMLTTRSLWDMVGGLNEKYFMYVEDLDFCKKIHIEKQKTIFLSKLCFIHYGGYGASREKLLKKGFKIYINEYMTGLNKVLSSISLEINFLIKTLKNKLNKENL